MAITDGTYRLGVPYVEQINTGKQVANYQVTHGGEAHSDLSPIPGVARPAVNGVVTFSTGSHTDQPDNPTNQVPPL